MDICSAWCLGIFMMREWPWNRAWISMNFPLMIFWSFLCTYQMIKIIFWAWNFLLMTMENPNVKFGQSTISIRAMFNNYVANYQRVVLMIPIIPIIYRWFSTIIIHYSNQLSRLFFMVSTDDWQLLLLMPGNHALERLRKFLTASCGSILRAWWGCRFCKKTAGRMKIMGFSWNFHGIFMGFHGGLGFNVGLRWIWQWFSGI